MMAGEFRVSLPVVTLIIYNNRIKVNLEYFLSKIKVLSLSKIKVIRPS